MDFICDLRVSVLSIVSVVLELFENLLNIRKRCESNERLDGKVVLITGANTGIGKETAYQLALRGAKIIIGCRDVDKGLKAAQEIKDKILDTKTDIIVLKLDLSSLSSVRQFSKRVAKQETNIDILINNAGVMACPEWQTEDGFEMQFGTNHLGHFLLTLSLMPLLKKSSAARVVTVSSLAHMKGQIHFENINLRNGVYNPSIAYRQSKIANIMFTRELAKRLGPQSTVKAYCLHPGIIRTDLWRHSGTGGAFRHFMQRAFLIDANLGSQTTLYCTLEKTIENDSGFYYDNCKQIKDKCMVWRARDDKSAQLLWELSSDLVKLEDNLQI